MFSKNSLKKKRLEKNYTQVEIANKLNINRSSYNSWESGRAVPNQKNLITLAAILDVPITYFESEYTIVQNYLQLNPSNQTLAESYVEDLLQEQEASKVTPLFPIQVKTNIALSAGLGNNFFDEYDTETVYSEEEFSGFDVATWIEGDSMEPVYQSGEVALIRETGFDYDGAVYAVAWNDQVYIKKVYLEEDGFKLVSLNSNYSDKFAPAEDNPKIVGKVIGHFIPIISN